MLPLRMGCEKKPINGLAKHPTTRQSPSIEATHAWGSLVLAKPSRMPGVASGKEQALPTSHGPWGQPEAPGPKQPGPAELSSAHRHACSTP